MTEPIIQAIFDAPGERLAVFDRGREHTFRALRDASLAVADRLGGLSLDHHARVAALLPNSFDAATAFLGTALAGHAFLPLNTDMKPGELRVIFDRCGIRAVLCEPAMIPSLPEGVAAVAVDGPPQAMQAGATAAADRLEALEPEREFVCLNTSGSTGAPRTVVRTAASIRANVRQVAAALEVTAGDRFLSVVPFWHANGFSNCLLMPLHCGAGIITMERFLPRLMFELIQDAGPTVVMGSPFVFRALARVVPTGAAFGHVRAWISSGAALPSELHAELRGQGIFVRQLYGSSEAGTISISGTGDVSVGRPLDGVQVRVVDADGQVLPAGRRGHIEVASPALFSGYVGVPESELPFTRDGYYRMGDLGWLDRCGRLALAGRADAVINVAGVKVDPEEIRQVIASMPGVVQAVVFGVRDAIGQEVVKASLVANGEMEAEDVLRYCRQRLAEYKLPRTIEFVDEIPQDLMGKRTQRLLDR